MPQACYQKRSEERTVCAGEVCLSLDGPPPLETRGQLVDVSSHGFRAIHHKPLLSGTEVRFQHKLFVGRARVVWTRTILEKSESGFQVLRG